GLDRSANQAELRRMTQLHLGSKRRGGRSYIGNREEKCLGLSLPIPNIDWPEERHVLTPKLPHQVPIGMPLTLRCQRRRVAEYSRNDARPPRYPGCQDPSCWRIRSQSLRPAPAKL